MVEVSWFRASGFRFQVLKLMASGAAGLGLRVYG